MNKIDTTKVRIVPNSWMHQCTSVNTVTGFIEIVVNGVRIESNIKADFVNSSHLRPVSLKSKWNIFECLIFNELLDKITLMKSYGPGFWAENELHVSNVNIFRFFKHANLTSKPLTAHYID